jgi:hypothetical protein
MPHPPQGAYRRPLVQSSNRSRRPLASQIGRKRRSGKRPPGQRVVVIYAPHGSPPSDAGDGTCSAIRGPGRRVNGAASCRLQRGRRPCHRAGRERPDAWGRPTARWSATSWWTARRSSAAPAGRSRCAPGGAPTDPGAGANGESRFAARRHCRPQAEPVLSPFGPASRPRGAVGGAHFGDHSGRPRIDATSETTKAQSASQKPPGEGHQAVLPPFLSG